jgi:DHA3 family tetracycline resistance protein-like MFS transporter
MPPEALRATMFSVAGQMDAIGQVCGGPGVGAIGRWWSLRAAILCSASLLAPVLPLVSWASSLAGRKALMRRGGS